MNMDNFRGRDLKNVIKIVCDQEFFRELVDFPNMVLKDNMYYYKGIPISIDENLKYKTCELLYKKNNNNFYDGIVSNLKQEAKHLNERLTKFRNNSDMNGYIATLKSLRETLDLIKKYDWQLMYSEYGVVDDKDDSILKSYITEIAVWEQNNEGNIKNYKVWKTNIPYKKGINIRGENGKNVFYMDCNGLIINGAKII